MSKKQLLTATVLCLIVVAILIGILIGTGSQVPEETTAPTQSTQPLPEASQIYDLATAAIEDMQAFTLAATIEQQTSVGGECFAQRNQRVQRHTDIGTYGMQVMVNESISMDDYTIAYSEAYSRGTVYLIIDESGFYSQMTAETFLSRHIPALLLDRELYGSLTASQDGGRITLSFTQPSAPEGWAIPEGAIFQTAGGSMTVSADYTLLESTYSITYTLGDATVEKTIRTGINPEVISFTMPRALECTHITAIDAPLLLERSCGYLLQADSVTADISETIVCEAYSDTRQRSVVLSMLLDGDRCTAGIDISTTLVNTSRGDEVTVKEQAIRFADDTYTVSIDGSAPTVEDSVTSAQMCTYCQDYLLSTVLIPGYITGVTVTDTGSTYRYEFTANETFAQLLCQSACQILYQDPALLSNVATAYSTDAMTAYLEIHKRTGLPIGSGISYCATHFIEGYPYLLRYETSQSYRIPGSDANNME